MTITEILDLLGKINSVLPLVLVLEKHVVALFKEMTAGLSNAERIALLKQAGVTLETKGEAWFAEHGLPLNP